MTTQPRTIFAVSTVLISIALACGGAGTDPATPTANDAAQATSPAPPAAAAVEARPLYYDREITPADLDGRTLRELALMRNTIFARAGHPFAKPWLAQHFRDQPWYHPGKQADLSKLSAADKANVDIIAAAENGFSRSELVARAEAFKGTGSLSADQRVEIGLISAALGEWAGGDSVPAAQRNPLEDPSVLDKQLTNQQIAEMSRRDLRLLRNTIYARRGRPFKSELLAVYFGDMAWYEPDTAFTEDRLSDIDRRNVALVRSLEDRLGGPLTDWEHMAEEGWFAGA